MTPSTRLLALGFVWLSSACFGDKVLSQAGGAGGGTAGAPSNGGGGSTSSDGGATTDGGNGGIGGGDGGTGGSGGAGGGAAVLVDTDLIARYYLDEAASGQGPAVLADAATDPLPLAIQYTAALGFQELAGNRALSWAAGQTSARAEALIDGTKIHSALQGSMTTTIEAVVNGGALPGYGQRIVTICQPVADGGQVTLGIEESTGYLYLELPDGGSGSHAGAWNLAIPAAGRSVLHVVVDTAQVVSGDRVRAFRDGVPLAPAAAPFDPVVEPALNAPLDLLTNASLVVGNRKQRANRSMVGSIGYVALYSAALGDDDVAQNAAVLQTNDDTP